ncbi:MULTISPECIES: oligosaccharide flippase family protein [unclassified Thioalkalivibrio]|uniref:oligosaccharide flippase family protein n=1 Tax=unclassified Thioalkalivibrio TaxID=2621013 RepID=UPI00037B9EB3|nr:MULTISPECIES: oligosaccharide flippase family protein [unclassified Thioalkalivibrio]
MKERLKRLLPKNRFARSVSVLAGGTAAGQIIVVAASPILTRLYSPEDFGLLAVYAGLLGILGVIASLRYQLAIPLPESDEEAASVVVLSLLVVLGMTAVSAVIVWIWGGPITATLNTPALEPYLWLLPIGLFLIGVYQVFNYWAIRVKAFPAIARTKLTQALSMVGVQLGGYALGPVALLLGQVSGQAAGTSSLGLLAIRRKWATFRKVRLTDIRWSASRYRRFPIYSSWSGVFNKTGTELPAILFAALFSPAVAGIYMLAHRVLAMPMSLLGKAIADVFFSSASKANRDGSLATLVSGIHTKMAHIAMPPALLLLLLGPDLFAFAFGDPWRQAGQFAQWMAPFLYIQFVTSPLSTLHSVVEKQAQGAFFHVVLLMVRVVGLSIGGLREDVMLAVALFSIGSALCWVGFLLWLLSLSGSMPIWTAASSTIKAIGAALLVGLPVMVVVALGMSGEFLVSAIVLSTVALFIRYYTLLRSAY